MENKQPFFSIVIATWNRGNMIAKTLDSVFAQLYDNFEVIVVDDGSTDNTREVVNSFSDVRLRYLYQENSERGAARNNGTRNATGNYITFLDSDDLLKPEHLTIVYKNLEAHSFPGFFHQSFQIEDVNGVVIVKNRNIYSTPLRRLIRRGNFMGCAGLFLNQQVAHEFLFDENMILGGSEDYEMLLRLTMHHPIICGEEMTTRVINHENRGEIVVNKDKLMARVDYLLDKVLKDKEFVSRYKCWVPAFKGSNYSFVALHLSLHKEKRIALRYFWKAVKSNPTLLLSKRFLIIISSIVFK